MDSDLGGGTEERLKNLNSYLNDIQAYDPVMFVNLKRFVEKPDCHIYRYGLTHIASVIEQRESFSRNFLNFENNDVSTMLVTVTRDFF